MDFALSQDLLDIRRAVRELCDGFGPRYWRELEPDRYPTEFVGTLTEHGWLAALIPQRYGGAGLGLDAASVILEEINASGGNAAACHAQMYVMGTVLRHGSEEQRERWLPPIASGELRLQAFAVTEPGAGSDTTAIQTTARRSGEGWVVNGQKVWTSRALHSDLMVLLARTTPADEVERRTEGLSLFLVDMRERGSALEIRPIATMINHATTEVFFNDLELPADALIGEEGQGFRHVLDGMNAERILIASECIGDGRFFVERAARYASERNVFGRPIGANQGVQFPIARAHMALSAADLVRWRRLHRVRGRRAVRAGREHGQVPRVRGFVAGRERVPGHARRLRLRGRLRHRAQVPRDAPVPRRAGLQQSRAGVRRPARPGDAPVLLTSPP